MAKQQSGGGYYFTPQSVTTQIDWSDVSKQVTEYIISRDQGTRR